jgi:hypothetical protein
VRRVGGEPCIEKILPTPSLSRLAGKTVQAIGIMGHFPENFPLLIVVPSSVKLNWCAWTWRNTPMAVRTQPVAMPCSIRVQEMLQWSKIPLGEISVVQAQKDVERLNRGKVVIMTYGLLTNKSLVAQALPQRGFQVTVHALSDTATKRRAHR